MKVKPWALLPLPKHRVGKTRFPVGSLSTGPLSPDSVEVDLVDSIRETLGDEMDRDDVDAVCDRARGERD